MAGQGPNQQLAAGNAGAGAMGSAVGQYASARGMETAQAAKGYTGLASAQRVGDLVSAGMSQEQALHQAQLEASQRARNDAMAQFYTTQEDDIRRQQLAAMGAYEAQRDTNYMNAGNAGRRQAARNNEQATQAVVNTADMGGKVMTMGAMSMKDETRKGGDDGG